MKSKDRNKSNRVGTRSLVVGCALLVALAYYALSSRASRSPLLDRTPTTTTSRHANILSVEADADSDSDTASQRPWSKRIVAVGDIHGDLPHLTKILRMAELVNMKGQWIGGRAVLVQTGDIVDRGKDTIALYRFFDVLRGQAEKAGGAVVSLLGNHEIMNAMGDWRYVTPEDIATFGGERNRRAAMSTEGWIGQTWLANYSITARVPFTNGFPYLPASLVADLPATPRGSSSRAYRGDPSPPPAVTQDPFSHAAISFVHGGILPAYLHFLASSTPITSINDIGSSLLYSLLAASAPLALPRNATREQRELWSERGPLWDRTYALDEDEGEVCELAKEACKLLGVRRLVMGHTPNFEGMRARCGGTVLLIDTGISRAYGGALSALEVLVKLTPKAQAVAAENLDGLVLPERDLDEDETGEWIEEEIVSAIYTDGRARELLAHSERTVQLDLVD